MAASNYRDNLPSPASGFGAGGLIYAFAPAVESFHKAHDRMIAHARCLRILLAIHSAHSFLSS